MINKKIFLAAITIAAGTISASAQKFTKLEDLKKNSTEQTDATSSSDKKDNKGIKQKKSGSSKELTLVDSKYLAGAVPMVDGKAQWTTTINCPGVTAQQAYDRAIAFLKTYCQEEGKTHKDNPAKQSNIAVVNAEDHQIGAKIFEDVVFHKKAFSQDIAVLNYTLIVDCNDNSCKVTMYRMTYTYEADRGGGTFPAEEMISDANALNSAGTGFRRGAGFEKFRTKTIDLKDKLFQRLSDAINGK